MTYTRLERSPSGRPNQVVPTRFPTGRLKPHCWARAAGAARKEATRRKNRIASVLAVLRKHIVISPPRCAVQEMGHSGTAKVTEMYAKWAFCQPSIAR